MIKNNKGFTIVQVIIAASLVSIMSLSVFQGVEIARKAESKLRDRSDFNDLLVKASKIIYDQSLCSQAFIKSDGSPATFGRVDNTLPASALLPSDLARIVNNSGGLNTIILEPGKSFGALKIDSMSLDYQKDSSGNPIPPYVNPFDLEVYHLAQFIVRAKPKNGGNLLSNETRPLKIVLKTNLNNNLIQTCEPGVDLSISPSAPPAPPITPSSPITAAPAPTPGPLAVYQPFVELKAYDRDRGSQSSLQGKSLYCPRYYIPRKLTCHSNVNLASSGNQAFTENNPPRGKACHAGRAGRTGNVSKELNTSLLCEYSP